MHRRVCNRSTRCPSARVSVSAGAGAPHQANCTTRPPTLLPIIPHSRNPVGSKCLLAKRWFNTSSIPASSQKSERDSRKSITVAVSSASATASRRTGVGRQSRPTKVASALPKALG